MQIKTVKIEKNSTQNVREKSGHHCEYTLQIMKHRTLRHKELKETDCGTGTYMYSMNAIQRSDTQPWRHIPRQTMCTDTVMLTGKLVHKTDDAEVQ